VKPLRIELHVQIYPKTKIENGRDACHELIRFSENVLGFQSEDTRPKYMAETLSKIFGHYAYTPIGHPSNLGNRLKGLFAIQGMVIPNSGDKYFCYTVGGGPIIDGQLKN